MGVQIFRYRPEGDWKKHYTITLILQSPTQGDTTIQCYRSLKESDDYNYYIYSGTSEGWELCCLSILPGQWLLS